MARDQAVEDAYRFTRLAANNQDALVEQARSLLQHLSIETEILDPETCPQNLQRLHDAYAQFNSFNVATLDGEITCSSPTREGTAFIGDRAYFQRTLRENAFVVGEIVVGRVTNQLVQPYAIPITNEAGETQAVFIATTNLNRLVEFAASLQLPPQSTVLIVDDQGTVITRYPEAEKWAGQTLNNMPLIVELLANRGEGSTELPGLDGVQRLYAFTPIQSTETQALYLTVGIPAEIAYANSDRLMRQNLTLIGLAALLALSFAWFGGDVLFLRVVSLTAERDLAEKNLREINTVLEDRVVQRTEELAKANEQLQEDLAERERLVSTLQQRETELRGALYRLEQSNRDLQDFAYITSHDLQEPLRKIQAFSERLEQRYAAGLDEEGLDFLRRIHAGANRMQTMINALLTYSRVNTKGHAFEPTDLRAIAQDVVSDLEILIQETGGEVTIGDLPTIDADPTQIAQLFQNLISNALKFHRPGVPPRIQIREDQDGQYAAVGNENVTISVEDNGIGFEVKYLDKIFKPFQRLHSRDAYEGSGIGLAVCRKIIERLNGTITATSIPGHGSNFLVTLPRTQPERKRTSPNETG